MTKDFDYFVFICRAQPFHAGHLYCLDQALTLGKRVIVLIGNANRPLTIRDPWTFSERATMIHNSISSDQRSRIMIRPLNTYFYDDQKWAAHVQETVKQTIDEWPITSHSPRIGIIGSIKDQTSGYLRMFPQWKQVSIGTLRDINATDIRRAIFENDWHESNFIHVSPQVYDYIRQMSQLPHFSRLYREYDLIKKYKESWTSAPYEPTFVTADAVVVQSGHVLMVTRKSSPGEDLLALPGGFVNTTEFVECAALRELKEETKIDVPGAVLRGHIKDSHVFDHPLRSLRGRTITHAFFIELSPGHLPKVCGNDDASAAQWIPLSALDSNDIFEDHWDIIQYFLGS